MLKGARQGNTLNSDELNTALAGTIFAGTVKHFDAVGSTNDLALGAARAGATQGVWVADEQTAGRGRGNHEWLSSPGDGLYVSVLITPQTPESVLQLSLAAGLSAWEAIREVTGIVADIRWPNDLVTRETPRSRKLGGVLVETSGPGLHSVPAGARYAVLGIGLNVAHRAFPAQLASEATSLFLEGWQAPDRQPLLLSLLRQLNANLLLLEGQRNDGETQPGVFERLNEASTWLNGKRVYVPEQGGYTGETAGLDSAGFLLVDGDDGQRRMVRSGGVREAQALSA